MNFELPALPYAANALEPVINERTVFHHYEKHHQGYLTKLDAALTGDQRDRSLEQIIQDAHGRDQKVFNLAAQVWNHTFYWQSLTPGGGDLGDAQLLGMVDSQFGSFDALKQALHANAVSHFGSGWSWLVFDPAAQALEVTSTSDAETPLTDGKSPLLTIDVWEHAYYLDYQQDRAAYLDGVIGKLLNWSFAADNLERALRP